MASFAKQIMQDSIAHLWHQLKGIIQNVHNGRDNWQTPIG